MATSYQQSIDGNHVFDLYIQVRRKRKKTKYGEDSKIDGNNFISII